MITADEYELLEFFEVEPRLLDLDVPWSYNKATYEVNHGDLRLKFIVAPAYGDIEMMLHREDDLIHELTAQAVSDLRFVKGEDGERLECQITKNHSVWIKMKPFIHIKQSHCKEDC